MSVEIGGIFTIIAIFSVVKFFEKDTKNKECGELTIDKSRNKNKPYTSIKEYYLYSIYYTRIDIEKALLKDNYHIQKNIQYYLTSSHTKYGNYYNNIYKKYCRKIIINEEHANELILSFEKSYSTSTKNLASRLNKEHNNKH